MAATIIIEDKQENHANVFSPYSRPVAYVNPGDRVVVNAPDALTNHVTKKEHLFTEQTKKRRHGNAVIGPVYINGAKKGDTLSVKIIDIKFRRDFAISCIVPRFGSLIGNPENAAVLNEPYPEHTYYWELNKNGDEFYEKELDIAIPVKPMIGCIGVSPEIEAISSKTPDMHGGNMDVKCACPGNTMYFPVLCDGAYFFCGDCHGNQGDGEICGQALEISAEIHLEFGVEKDKKIRWPRVESPDRIMVIGSGRPMEEAGKVAYIDLIRWMQSEYHFNEADALQILTQVGEMYVGNSCSAHYSLVASIEKKYLNSRAK